MSRSAPGGVRAWQVGVVLTTILTIVMNVLANVLPIGGRDTGQISDMFPTTVTPAGYVFSIWLVIYVGLVGYAIWQALPARRDHDRAAAIALPVMVANVANALWIVAWHNLWIGTALLLMLVLLGALCTLYVRLRARGPAPDRGERLWAWGTFSVYLGWITVATVANVSIYFVDLGWGGDPLPASAWGALTLVVATALGVRMLRWQRDAAYALVLVWAFIGIVVAQTSLWLVAGTAVLGVLVLAYVAAATPRKPGYTGAT
ncbi:tryptophan-rich sensory protein [soil metagenome]|nr:tryptophan-rich sensory protein [Trueperaceae bacterium]